MKFAQDSQEDGYVITAYDENSVSINGKSFTQSLVVTTTRLNENWNIADIKRLSSSHIEEILCFQPELVIIGTGNRLVFPEIEVYSSIIKHGIGVDFMDTGAACRTYNILMSEGRDVVAGLIL
ncbi:MAG: Mth938-like domain-containing protein [Gammaproteobacteria bacterium]|nr:Mth938-like domain-containing protein [Gammaproteobacteria bacterium]NNJ49234.1 Xcc1710-like domain-containing protein [Gammaproteobacteria bacterium]